MLLLFNSAALASSPAEPKNVLILSSFEYELPAFNLILDKIRMSLRAGLTNPINIYVEHLDVERFPDERYSRGLFQFSRQKYVDRKMDLFIPFGLYTLDLASKYGRDSFGGVPTLFIEIGNRLPGTPSISRQPNMTGVLIEYDLKKILDTALSLHPGTLEVFVVVGSSPAGRFARAIFQVAYREYEDKVKFTYLADLTMQDLLRKVSNLPKKSIVIFTTFQRDAAGKSYHQRDAVRLIAEGSNAPVYVITDALIGLGAVGGYVASTERVGLKASDYALRILRGEHPDALPVVREGFNLHIFDWRQLRRWNLREGALPKGSVVLNKQLTLWDLRYYVIGTLAFCLLETALIILLIVQRRRKKVAEEELRQRTEDLDQFFNVNMDLFCIADTSGYFEHLNPVWEKVFGYTRDELMAKRFLEFIHPDDVEHTKEALSTLATQVRLPNFVNRYRCRDGTYRWLEWNSAPVGNLIYAAARDITERKQGEEALEERLKFEKLLADLSARFINLPADQLDAEIADAQQQVCECLGIDVSTLWQLSKDHPSSLLLTHYYAPPGIPPVPKVMDAKETSPWCLEKMRKRGYLLDSGSYYM